MSAVEILNVEKKILGKLPKSEFSEHDKPLDKLSTELEAVRALLDKLEDALESVAGDSFRVKSV